MIGVIIKTDGACSLTEVKTLEDFQAKVSGEYIEVVPFGWDASFFCNEEGKFMGLPPNPVATKLIYKSGGFLLPGDVVVGDVLIVGPATKGLYQRLV